MAMTKFMDAKGSEIARYFESLDRIIRTNLSPQVNRVPYLKGVPGIGKTEYVRSFAERHGMILVEVALTSCVDETELSGHHLPYMFRIPLGRLRPEDARFVLNLLEQDSVSRLANVPERGEIRDETLVETPGLLTFPPQFFMQLVSELSRHDSRSALLFLDELSAATPGMQSVLQDLLLERRVGTVSLPPNVAIITAGNPAELVPRGTDFYAALARRVTSYEFQPNFDYWTYRIRARYQEKVIDGRLNYSFGMGEAVIGFLQSPEHSHYFNQYLSHKEGFSDWERSRKVCNPALWEQLVARLSVYEERCLLEGRSPCAKLEADDPRAETLYQAIACGVHHEAAPKVLKHLREHYRVPEINPNAPGESLSVLPLHPTIHDRVIAKFVAEQLQACLKKSGVVASVGERRAVLKRLCQDAFGSGEESFPSLVRKKYAALGWSLDGVEPALRWAEQGLAGEVPGSSFSGWAAAAVAGWRFEGDAGTGRPASAGMTRRMEEFELLLDLALVNNQTPMVYGPPGVGKSTFFRDYCARRGYAYVELPISACTSETSIAGVRAPQLQDLPPDSPAAVRAGALLAEYVSDPLARLERRGGGETEKLTVPTVKSFFPPKFLETLEKASKAGRTVLLVVEELTNATEAMQSVLMSLLYDRKISGGVLPPNVKLAATGNYPSQVSRGGTFFSAFDRRIMDFHFPVDFNYWCLSLERRLDMSRPGYATAYRVVRDYLASTAQETGDVSRSYAFNANSRTGENRNNPATWEYIVRFIGEIHEQSPDDDEINDHAIRETVKGVLAPETAAAFATFYMEEKMLSLSQIIETGVAANLALMPRRQDQVRKLLDLLSMRILERSMELRETEARLNQVDGKVPLRVTERRDLTRKRESLTASCRLLCERMEEIVTYYDRRHEDNRRMGAGEDETFPVSTILAAHQGVLLDILKVYRTVRQLAHEEAVREALPTLYERAHAHLQLDEASREMEASPLPSAAHRVHGRVIL